VIRIAISVEAFEAIAKTLPFGSVGYENKINDRGERLIWLEPDVFDRLRALRGPGESYSDVILRLASRSGQEGR
jgi:Putative antitoxin